MHFFNRWPMPPPEDFLKCFPTSDGGDIPDWSVQQNKALLDATPEYLFNSVAAPRVKQMVPQAKFVIILRVRGLALDACTRVTETVLLHRMIGLCQQTGPERLSWPMAPRS